MSTDRATESKKNTDKDLEEETGIKKATTEFKKRGEMVDDNKGNHLEIEIYQGIHFQEHQKELKENKDSELQVEIQCKTSKSMDL